MNATTWIKIFQKSGSENRPLICPYDRNQGITEFLLIISSDHGGGSSDHFSALKIWMFENKFVSLPSHLKTIEPIDHGVGSDHLSRQIT